MSIKVALIGGGIWAREEHAPAIEASQHLTLQAVYSRTTKTAQSVADAISKPLDIYSEEEAGKGFEEILKRPDIHAVIVSLSIKSQPPYIKRALLAGKHVLSEKPVAENVKDAVELIKWYRTEIKGQPTWTVAENFRFLNSIEYAAGEIKKLGRIIGFSGLQNSLIELNWKFNLTEWRRTPTHQGGYILDGGVHDMAALRVLLGAHPGNEVARLSAVTAQVKEYLPPVDTADVTLHTRSGVMGTFATSKATPVRANEWTITCEDGWVMIEGDDKVTVSRGSGGKGEEQGVEVKTVPNERTGVPPEIRAWGEALAEGKVRAEQEPEAALADLELIELLLRSGERGGVTLSTAHQDVYSVD